MSTECFLHVFAFLPFRQGNASGKDIGQSVANRVPKAGKGVSRYVWRSSNNGPMWANVSKGSTAHIGSEWVWFDSCQLIFWDSCFLKAISYGSEGKYVSRTCPCGPRWHWQLWKVWQLSRGRCCLDSWHNAYAKNVGPLYCPTYSAVESSQQVCTSSYPLESLF